MKTAVLAALLFTSTLTIGTVAAQPAPYNEIGVTMGHWHIISKDVEANKKLFLGMGGKLFMPGGNPLMMFPGIYINLNLGTEKGDGGTQGSVVNHVGFIVDNVQERVAQWKAAGVPVLPGNNNRLDQAFVETPDGVRIEILEDKTQSMPIRHEHVHFFLPEAEIPKAQAWYAKTFGGKAGTRNNAPVVDVPGGQLRFAKADTKQAPTRGRVLDHIGFDVRDHQAVVKKIEAEGITLDEPVRKSPRPATPSRTSRIPGAPASRSLNGRPWERWCSSSQAWGARAQRAPPRGVWSRGRRRPAPGYGTGTQAAPRPRTPSEQRYSDRSFARGLLRGWAEPKRWQVAETRVVDDRPTGPGPRLTVLASRRRRSSSPSAGTRCCRWTTASMPAAVDPASDPVVIASLLHGTRISRLPESRRRAKPFKRYRSASSTSTCRGAHASKLYLFVP